MLYRNSCRTRSAKRFRILSEAARSALAEPLESRVHLSYDDRGTISVIVEGGVASSLTAELTQYEQDLIGDGWRIAPDVSGQISHLAAPWMDDNRDVWNNNTVTPFARSVTSDDYQNDLVAVKSLLAADAAAATQAGSQLKSIRAGRISWWT